MAITRETVLHVARLARLDLSEDEVEHMKRDLSSILDYVEELSLLDTSQVPETAQVAVEAAPLRADQRKPGVANEVALAESARSSGGAFAVPAFVDET
ncbi:MAG TPA: Asp-tRNA(Asn)/Glu-tRNA(Gln) amidotransferase subunit GatC [Polyangiaceae bacterium]|jgi:aspartyl-tRNA(Asn)/glutamyl-tRNA(Gln) amidotransferase subunit C|nr:Asp-tRNA(Asn)/Glu-tRNA(Gln) amidotransferase subunit GatC [Polyangiaceae bacterium]